MNPDNICEKYSNKKVKIKTWVDESTIFIEGSSEVLEFMGELFLAMSKNDADCGFEISPADGGKAFFSKGSTTGIYIHRLPCE